MIVSLVNNTLRRSQSNPIAHVCKGHGKLVVQLTSWLRLSLSFQSTLSKIHPHLHGRPKKLKESKRQKLDQLRAATEVKTEKRYYVVFPTKEAHHSVHPTEGAIGYAQRIHPKLVEKKIQDLVAEGITNVPEVTRALKYC